MTTTKTTVSAGSAAFAAMAVGNLIDTFVENNPKLTRAKILDIVMADAPAEPAKPAKQAKIAKAATAPAKNAAPVKAAKGSKTAKAAPVPPPARTSRSR